MQIWTTPQLHDQFLEKGLPVQLLSEEDLKDSFLKNSKSGDIAVLGIDEDYLKFLADVKERGFSGPIIFISLEPTIAQRELYEDNAVILDVKSMGAAAVKNLLRFTMKLAMTRVVMAQPEEASFPERVTELRPEEQPIEDPRKVMEVLRYSIKAGMPVIVAFEISEHGEPVTARGICNIKELNEAKMVLYRFRQSLLLKGLKKGLHIKLFLSYKDRNDEAAVELLKTGDGEIETTLPQRLYSIKDMRIQPNAQKPVKLYVTIPNEPTTSYKVADISPRGISFFCPRDLPVGAVYNFTMILPDPENVAHCFGTIRYKKELGNIFRYGAEIKPHPWDEESLAKYIMKRETEIIGLLRSM